MITTLAPQVEDNTFSGLHEASQNILHHAFYLLEQKQMRSRHEYQQLLLDSGWTKTEAQKYLKVAQAFGSFSPADLGLIEPRTLYQLAENSKKYQSVINQLQKQREITQQSVRELIDRQRQPRQPKSEKPSIWRYSQAGSRYCQIPPIHEEDERTGLTLQQMIDDEHLLPQQIVADAIALLAAYKQQQLVWKEQAATVADVSPQNDDDHQPDVPVSDDQPEVEQIVVALESAENHILAIEQQPQPEDKDIAKLPPQQPNSTAEVTPEPQPHIRLVSLPRKPSIEDDKALSELDLWNEEFGNGETEPIVALKNSENYINQIEQYLETYQAKIYHQQHCPSALQKVKDEIKTLTNLQQLEIWQAYQQAQSWQIELKIYEIYGGDTTRYEYCFDQHQKLTATDGNYSEHNQISVDYSKDKFSRNSAHLVSDGKFHQNSNITKVSDFRQHSHDVNVCLDILGNEHAYDDYLQENCCVLPSTECSTEKIDPQQVVEILQQVQTWSEVTSLLDNRAQDFKQAIWDLLLIEDKQRLHQLKQQYLEQSTNSLQVGDKVIWNSCPAHLTSLMPFLVTDIQGEKAFLDYYAKPVELADLEKVSHTTSA